MDRAGIKQAHHCFEKDFLLQYEKNADNIGGEGHFERMNRNEAKRCRFFTYCRWQRSKTEIDDCRRTA